MDVPNAIRSSSYQTDMMNIMWISRTARARSACAGFRMTIEEVKAVLPEVLADVLAFVRKMNGLVE
jgi:hypothetical protein